MPEKIEVALNKALTEYTEELNDELFRALSKSAKQAKRDVVQNSASDTGDYKKGWTVRTKRERAGAEVIVHNKKHPRLTHLLENGHVIRNKYGTYGRTNGDHVIEKAQREAEAFLMSLLNKEL